MLKNFSEKTKMLSSLAFFRQLFDSKKDSYDVIGEFIKAAVSYNAKYSFSLSEITTLINETYGFNLFDSVIKFALGRFKDSFSLDSGIYVITNKAAFAMKEDFSDKMENLQKDNNLIIENLIKFIESEKKKLLSEEKKEKAVEAFCSFLMEGSSSQEYAEYISTFIIKGGNNADFTKQLNSIKQAVISYTGLNYSASPSDLGAWTTDLTIFLETEMLFHFAGYNGALWEKIFMDFFSLVKEINAKSHNKTGKHLIKLRYFTEVKDDYEHFFKKAEFIVEGKEVLNPSKDAMRAIVDNCKTPSDVLTKKVQFESLLQTNLIKEVSEEKLYSEENRKYSLEGSGVLQAVAANTGIEDPFKYVKYLNYINIYRKGDSKRGFENMGYILLSGTSNTLQIAWDPEIKKEKEVPLASDLGYMINKFWFKLNKGFGQQSFPKTFDIVTKAQIALSSLMNDSIAQDFDEMDVKYRKGEITKDQALGVLVKLREQSRRAEDINSEEAVIILHDIKNGDIAKYMQEKEHLKVVAEQAAKEKEEALKEKNKALEEKDDYARRNKENEAVLAQYREKDALLAARKERNKKTYKKIGTGLLLVAVVGVWLFLGCQISTQISKFWGTVPYVLAAVSSILTILSFFGISWENLKRKTK